MLAVAELLDHGAADAFCELHKHVAVGVGRNASLRVNNRRHVGGNVCRRNACIQFVSNHELDKRFAQLSKLRLATALDVESVGRANGRVVFSTRARSISVAVQPLGVRVQLPLVANHARAFVGVRAPIGARLSVHSQKGTARLAHQNKRVGACGFFVARVAYISYIKHAQRCALAAAVARRARI